MRRMLLVCVALLLGCDPTDDAHREALAELARGAAPCETAADCCVVEDGCMATVYVVGADDFEEAKDLAADLDDDPCVGCITPAVQIVCESGRCLGVEMTIDDPNAERGDRCGVTEFQQAPAEATSGSILGCGGVEE